MLNITIYLDGTTSEGGYNYVIQQEWMEWTA